MGQRSRAERADSGEVTWRGAGRLGSASLKHRLASTCWQHGPVFFPSPPVPSPALDSREHAEERACAGQQNNPGKPTQHVALGLASKTGEMFAGRSQLKHELSVFGAISCGYEFQLRTLRHVNGT